MTRTTLYPSLVNPPQPQVNDFNQGIFQPWPDIIRPKIAKGLAIALIASGAIGPVLNPNKQVIPKTTYPAWSEPVRQKAGLKAYLQDTGAPDVPLPQPASTVVLQWIYPWSEPVRVKRFSTALQDVGAPDVPLPPPVLSSQWYAPWSDPVRVRKYATALQDVGTPDVVLPPPVLSAQWYEPWSEPTRVKRRPALGDTAAFVFAPTPVSTAVVIPTTWSTPPPVRKRVLYQSKAYPVNFTVTPSDIKWLYPWSEPKRVKKTVPLGDSSAFVFTPTTTPSTDVVVPTFWSGPPPQKRSVQYQAKTEAPRFAAPAVVDINWSIQWSTPVRPKTRIISQVDTWPVFTPTTPPPSTDVVVPTAWSGPPPRIRKVQYQGKVDPINFTAPVQVSYGWFQPLSVLPKKPFTVSDAAFGFAVVDNALTNFWYQPWPDFARGKRFLTANQQAWFGPTTTPAPVVVTDAKWLYPWSEPVRTRKFPTALQDVGAPDVPFPPPVVSAQWYEPWVDPVKLKPGLRTGLNQDLIWSNFTPAPPAVTDIKWSYGWSEPVRFKYFWTSLQQPLAFIPLITNASNNAAPYYPWSEPVRFKPGLKTHLQSFTSLATPPQPSFIRTINWYQPWSYPVWPKKGLKVWLQQFFDTDHSPPPQAPVFLVMNATETNNDVASFAINVYTSSPITPPPYTVVVSITEVQSGTNPWSIEEV